MTLRATSFVRAGFVIERPWAEIELEAQARHLRRKLLTLKDGSEVLVDFALITASFTIAYIIREQGTGTVWMRHIFNLSLAGAQRCSSGATCMAYWQSAFGSADRGRPHPDPAGRRHRAHAGRPGRHSYQLTREVLARTWGLFTCSLIHRRC